MKKWITIFLLQFPLLNVNLFSQFFNLIPGFDSKKEALNDSLLSAAYRDDFPGITKYLDKGADVNALDFYGQTPLMFVVQTGNLKLTEMLVEHGAAINVTPIYKYNNPPLISAAKFGYTDVTRFLLENKADVMIRDRDGASALHYAALYNDTTLFALLLKYHPDLEAKTNTGETPVFFAAFNGSTEMADKLIANGANVNAKNNKGYTPLMAASQNNQYETVIHLLEGWANINLQNSRGFSALSLAIANGNSQIADLLLLNNADKNEHNRLGLNPLEIAKLYHQTAIVDSLKKMDAKNNRIPYFSGLQPELCIKFNDKDILTGIGLLTHDMKYNLEFGIHYFLRPSAIQVLIPKGKNMYDQLWENRNLLGISFAKAFSLLSDNKKQTGFLGGINYDLDFEKYNNGADISTNTRLLFGPFAGGYYARNHSVYRFFFSCANYNIPGISNWYAEISIFFRFNMGAPGLNEDFRVQ